MTYDKEYQLKYHKDKIKRIPLDVTKEWYENELLPAVENAGETVNGFIKKAVQDRIDKENA